MRKWVIACIALALIALSSPVFANGTAEAKGTITVWDFKYGDVQGVQPVMKKIDELIMKQNPGMKIQHVGQPNDNYYQLLRAAVQAGEGPDVVMFHGGVQAYEFDSYTAELDNSIKSFRSEIPEFSWSFCSEGGNAGKPVHLVPITIQGMGIYYNKVLFKKAGLDPNVAPSDIASFMAACEKLKAAGIVPITAGLQGNPFTLDFLFRCLVANIYGPQTTELVTGGQSFKGNAGFKRAAQIVADLFAKGYIDPNGSSTPYFMDAANNFAAGKGAIFVGLNSDVCHWKVFDDALGKGNVGYFPTINFPEAKYKDQQVGQPCGIGYAIMKWSKNKEAAAKFIEGYAHSEGASMWMSMTGALSPNTKLDVAKMGYPLVGEILKRTANRDFVTLLTNEDANTNFDRYCTQAFVSQEISLDKFIDSCQTMLDNARAAD